MSNYKDLLARILAATDDGLQIITDLCPAAEAVAGTKKKFRLRNNDKNPSAVLYPPRKDKECDSWRVVDFGGCSFAAVNFYMWHRGYQDDQFMLALHELAEMYGVSYTLDNRVNVRPYTIRDATPEEMGRQPRIDLFEDFEGINLKRIWGPLATAEHLKDYNWHAVKETERIAGNKVITTTADLSTYCIFAQECHYSDTEGNDQVFHKIYEPQNPDKSHRFWIAGNHPKDYMYGRETLLRLWRKGGEKRLPIILVVSGGSDAICAWSCGYPAVWFDSERRQLTATELSDLTNYGKKIIYIPDIDTTGIQMGVLQALSLPTLYTAWLTPADLGGLHDNRGRLRKDLKDFLTLHPYKADMDRLVRRASRAKFWNEKKNEKSDEISYTISTVGLAYFLWLHGYGQLKDDHERKPQYIHVEGDIVRRVTAQSIRNFLNEWCLLNGVCEELQNKIMNCRSMPTNEVSTLKVRDDLDFTSATASSQILYFKNCRVEVTNQGITHQPYSVMSDGHYVWESNIIPHTYYPMKPMFKVTKDEDDHYHINIDPQANCNLLRFLVNSSRLYWRKADEQGMELTPDEKAEEELCLIVKLLNLGYMLHRYKSSSEARATLCLDYAMTDSDDDANGRSGKSFYINAISSMVNHASIDGRTMDRKTNMQFIYANVDENTAVFTVDECTKNFDFEFFFGQITGSITVEKKGKDPYVIPFSKAPKFIFGTNYVLKKHDPSRDARLWPVIFSDYYHQRSAKNDYLENRSIFDDFGQHLMKEDYSEHNWQTDIALMLQCLQLYLSLPVGKRQIMPPLARIERREQQAALGKDFRQWAEENLNEDSEYLDTCIKLDDLFNMFKQETRSPWSPSWFTKQLKNWCTFAEHISCYNPTTITGQKKDGDRWQKRENGKTMTYCHIQTVKKAQEMKAIPQQPSEQDLPF